MFDNPYLFIKIVVILTGLAFLIFRFQLLNEIISGYRKWKKKKNEIELNSKVEDYISEYKSNKIQNDNEAFIQNFAKPINLHLLRVVESDGNSIIYFSNTGGNVYNVKIKSSSVEKINIEPYESINQGSSGFIKIYNTNSLKNDILFEIFYLDEIKNKNSRKYLFSISDKQLHENY
ncbi:MAG: hypothetical protein KDC88_15085 [Ignavibacteriae bacterium]|nr:hypothetical protein [Ignavibacteriota bacterium]